LKTTHLTFTLFRSHRSPRCNFSSLIHLLHRSICRGFRRLLFRSPLNLTTGMLTLRLILTSVITRFRNRFFFNSRFICIGEEYFTTIMGTCSPITTFVFTAVWFGLFRFVTFGETIFTTFMITLSSVVADVMAKFGTIR